MSHSQTTTILEFSRLTHNPDTTRDWKIPMDGPTKKYGKAAFFGPIWGGPAMQDKLDSSNTFPNLIHYIHLYYWLVVSTPLKNMNVSWEGLSHILWKIQNV